MVYARVEPRAPIWSPPLDERFRGAERLEMRDTAERCHEEKSYNNRV